MVDIRDVAYHPFYCEENIWLLGQRTDLVRGPAEVAFIVGSGPRERVACWFQSAVPPLEAVLWDYHVVLAERRESGVLVWDLDTRLPIPCPADLWIASTFQDAALVPARYHPRFRVAPRETYLAELATDRSHMRDRRGHWLRPPPPWDPPGAPAMTLPRWRSLGEGPGELIDRAALEARWGV